MTPTFAARAIALCGATIRQFGWSTAQFWSATPSELWAVARTPEPPVATAPTRGEIAAMIEGENNG